MARRTRSTDTQDTNEAQEATVSTTTEAPEATASTEAVEAAAEAVDEQVAEAPKAADAEVDLTAFNAAVDTAIAEKDSSTGELAPVFIDPVNAEYRKLDGLKAKNKAKAALNERMKSAMNDLDITTARAYLALSDALTAAGGASHKAEKAPADPTEAFVQRVVGLRLALELATGTVPEGVAEDWRDKAKASFDENIEPAREFAAFVADESDDKGDEPEVSNVVKAAVKLSQGKAAKIGAARASGGGSFTGERRDIGAHIASAFESAEVGTFLSVAEIRNHTSSEYGDSHPSAGAISARLFPKSGKCTVEGVEPGTDEKGKKGATKVA